MIRVAVGGGRLNAKRRLAFAVLDELFLDEEEDITIIEGGAQGYDAFAESWAISRGEQHIQIKIDPNLDGWYDDAPKRRNQRLLTQEYPDIFVAFDGGPGTRDMYTRCEKAGVTIYEVEVTLRTFTVWQWAKGGKAATIVAKGKY